MVIRRFFTDESGAIAIEYGLIGGFILCAIIGTLVLISPEVKKPYETLAAWLQAANANN
jgi:Flp pilus assembly pilin Flp